MYLQEDNNFDVNYSRKELFIREKKKLEYWSSRSESQNGLTFPLFSRSQTKMEKLGHSPKPKTTTTTTYFLSLDNTFLRQQLDSSNLDNYSEMKDMFHDYHNKNLSFTFISIKLQILVIIACRLTKWKLAQFVEETLKDGARVLVLDIYREKMTFTKAIQ